MNKCEKCGYLHYRTDPCRVAKKSTAARKDVLSAPLIRGSVDSATSQRDKVVAPLSSPPAGTQALPVDTNSSMDGLGYDPSSVVLTTSAGTVGNKDRQPISEAAVARLPASKDGNCSTQGNTEARHLDADTPKRPRGRPRTITDMKVYKAMKQREYRARKK